MNIQRPLPPHRPGLRFGVLSIVCTLGLLARPETGRGQTAPAPTPSEATVTLQTFEVSASQDKGYRASNSVSGTRVNTPISELPLALQAFTEDFIQDVKPTSLFDIVRFAPGVTFRSEDFTGGNTRFSIRGFDVNGAALRNGLPGQVVVDPSNIARVEVVKGPASFLYGQIAPGGAVNLLTKRPLGRNTANLSTRVGTDDFFRSEMDVNVAASGGVAGRLVGSFENALAAWKPFDAHSWSVAPSGSWQISPRARLLAEYERYEKRENAPLMMKPNIFRSGLIGEFYPLPRDFNFSNDSDYRDVTTDNFTAELGVNFGEHWVARAVYAHGARSTGFRQTGQAGTGLVADVPADANNPAIRSIDALQRRFRLQKEDLDTDTTLVEAVGKYNWDAASLRLLAGYQYDESSFFSEGRQVPGGLQPRPWDLSRPSTWDRRNPFSDSDYSVFFGGSSDTFGKNAAWYGGLTLGLFKDRLTALAGFREADLETSSFNRLTGTPGRDLNKSKGAPQLGVLFKLTPEVNLFASYSESFVPNFTFLRVDGTPTTLAEPTVGEGYEAGVKTSLLGGRLSATATAFQIDNTNIVQNLVGFVNGQTVFTDVQSGVQRSKGVEFDAVWSPFDGLQVYGSYSYIDAFIQKNPANPAFVGRRLQASARHLSNLWVRYNFRGDALKGWYATFGANYTGRQQQRQENPGLFFAPYTLFDAAVGRDFKTAGRLWSLELSGKNLGDEEYFPSNNSRGLPRRVMLSASVRL